MRAVRSCHRTQTLPGTLPLCCHYSCFSVVRYRESGCVLGRKSKGRVGLTFFAVLCKSAGPPQASFQVPALADSFCRPGWEFLCATTSILNIHIHIHTHPSLLASGKRSGSPSSTAQLWWLLSSQRAQTQQRSRIATDRRRRAAGFRLLCPGHSRAAISAAAQTRIARPVCASRCIR